ncbi:LytTR family transcriptional regulator DNA-binding domain-containing protein [Fibrella aestuarina]|uniref:LytTR family transcriptional regulator DNA-binding domain-containing protein n=1 Tax=Fibrella aestuarina TaxID=651143 RepID=UPI0002E403C1|nr:LytTR family transcriptional regulator DNA-binding domain-containing protein [Fibrella aestuarina]
MHVITPLLSYPILLAYFSGADNYTWVYFRNGKRQLLAKPLVYFEQRLPGFIRIHKTALVNPAFVVDVEPPPRPKMAAAIRLQDGTMLPVSRRRWASVLATLQTVRSGFSDTSLDLTPMGAPALSNAMPPIQLLAILEGDARLLAEHCLNQLGLAYCLQTAQAGDDLTQALRHVPDDEWPALVLIDARTDCANCLRSVETIKGDPRLRIIPVVWLNGQDDCSDQAYQLDVNSVVAVPEEPDAFVRVLSQLFNYWFFLAQFPVSSRTYA